MSDRSHQPNALPAVLIALAAIGLILVLSLATTVTAQDTGTPEPTSEFNLNLPPTLAPPTGTLDPGQLPSLTGVGGQAANANVAIRSGPGLNYPRISYLAQGDWIDIVGWNGWNTDRSCSAEFKNDLDMWVQVRSGQGQGWIARCVLNIRGKIANLPIITASGERLLQR